MWNAGVEIELAPGGGCGQRDWVLDWVLLRPPKSSAARNLFLPSRMPPRSTVRFTRVFAFFFFLAGKQIFSKVFLHTRLLRSSHDDELEEEEEEEAPSALQVPLTAADPETGVQWDIRIGTRFRVGLKNTV